MRSPGKYLLGYILAVIAAVFMIQPAYAQVGFPVRMTLVDKSTGEPVGFATVSMTLKGAKEPLKYLMSSETGEVDFEGIVRGTYILKAELMGYKIYLLIVHYILKRNFMTHGLSSALTFSNSLIKVSFFVSRA